MARTTLNIDTPLLDEIKQIQKEEGGSLGAVVSRLLGDALARRSKKRRGRATKLRWTSRPMKARVDLEDKEALYRLLDGGDRP